MQAIGWLHNHYPCSITIAYKAMYVYIYTKQKQPGAVKKGAAKQSRIQSITWHLRQVVRTRADINLRPSGLVRPRTDIKLRPSAFVRTRTDFKSQTVGLLKSYKD